MAKLLSKTQIQENRQAWSEALRYGGYVQTTNTLRRTDEEGQHSYCCLGVACNVYQKRTGDGEWEKMGWDSAARFKQGDNLYGIATPPERVSAYFGLGDFQKDASSNVSDTVEGMCVVMNDDQRKDFEAIADYVDGLE